MKILKLNESGLMREKTFKQMQDLQKEVDKSGGDIAQRVRKDEQTKENKLPNAYYMDNPFKSNREISTNEAVSTKKILKLNDFSFIKSAEDDDKNRPMYNNVSGEEPYKILIVGDFVEVENKKAQIISIDKINGLIDLKITNEKDDKKSETKTYKLKDFLK
jgi:hypothetical protein